MSNEKQTTTHEATRSPESRENQTQYVTPADAEKAFLSGGYFTYEELMKKRREEFDNPMTQQPKTQTATQVDVFNESVYKKIKDRYPELGEAYRNGGFSDASKMEKALGAVILNRYNRTGGK